LSNTLNSAVQNSISAGITYVAAAGSNSTDACSYSPSSVSGAITVAAIGGSDIQSTYTNVGSCVDLYAPGDQILSAFATDDNITGQMTGTSQASAFVAGAAALYLETHPQASPAEVAQAIVSGATVGVVTGVSLNTPNLLLRVGDSGSPQPAPIGNQPPTASFTASCRKTSCTFNASGSKDDVGIVSYAWSFGDGTSASSTSSTVSHTYNVKGTVSETVTLVVTDAGGLSATSKVTLSIKAGR
jgi:subtilisin family serine protease